VVQPGETLYRIARRYEVHVEELMNLNRIEDAGSLRVGQELLIPGLRRTVGEASKDARPGTVLQGGSPPTLDVGQPAPGKGCHMEPAPRRAELSEAGLLWPVDGVLLARFGRKDGTEYPGIDVGAPMGTPVWAAESGRVVFAGPQPGFGRLVVLRSRSGRVTLYGRNAEICVREGDEIRRGAPIARLGDDGTGLPYLYFEVREAGSPVNPTLRLP
jgi:lipoprotein NlpD